MGLSHQRHITPPHKRRIQVSLRYRRILNWLGRIFLLVFGIKISTTVRLALSVSPELACPSLVLWVRHLEEASVALLTVGSKKKTSGQFPMIAGPNTADNAAKRLGPFLLHWQPFSPLGRSTVSILSTLSSSLTPSNARTTWVRNHGSSASTYYESVTQSGE